jgi:hypothetical protein
MSKNPKQKRTGKGKSSQALNSKHRTNPSKAATKIAAKTDPSNPYRPSSMYAILFEQGSKDYIGKEDLISKVAELTNKPKQSVGFAFEVLKNESHKSNGGRSTVIKEGKEFKFIPARRR